MSVDFRRLRYAWAILRGRTVVYRAQIAGTVVITRPGSIVAETVVRSPR